MAIEDDDLLEEARGLDRDLVKVLGEVEEDLDAFLATQPTTSSPSSPSFDARGIEEAATRVNGKLGKARQQLRELQILSEEAEKEDVFQELCKVVSDHKRRLEMNRSKAKDVLHNASLAMKHEAAKREREELLGRGVGPGKVGAARPSRTELEAAEKVTSSLQKTRQLLVRQLDHTGSTLGLMDESEQTLSKVNEKYSEQTGLLGRGKHLLTSMENQEKFERFLLYFCFCLFLLAVVYVGGKRVFYFAPVHKLVPGREGAKVGDDGKAIEVPSPPPPAPPPPSLQGPGPGPGTNEPSGVASPVEIETVAREREAGRGPEAMAGEHPKPEDVEEEPPVPEEAEEPPRPGAGEAEQAKPRVGRVVEKTVRTSPRLAAKRREGSDQIKSEL
ncbi:hypothetical protein HOP50_15g75600 [Chloropicon primus]|uniref:Sec20 C-terminal domain-containing protein n=2 Tax=Chloropicon primus TaxID=1764295 RepID=A0A5B8MWS5_9CHLO|nr:hypothetical protein A3770_15p75370 [Chloropicon primus]UPR04226.1 hypothetical protein HOP50_15g75600 [Chloropicon primus]|eukprot:QDZ25019.1 hypothetical protein A3770_15p75370 [Chloropicon primus]